VESFERKNKKHTPWKVLKEKNNGIPDVKHNRYTTSSTLIP